MIRFTPAQFCLTIIIINILARTKNRCNSQWPHSDQVDLHFLFKCETRQCEKIQLVQCVTNSAWLKCETSVLCSVWACSTQCAAHLGQCMPKHTGVRVECGKDWRNSQQPQPTAEMDSHTLNVKLGVWAHKRPFHLRNMNCTMQCQDTKILDSFVISDIGKVARHCRWYLLLPLIY